MVAGGVRCEAKTTIGVHVKVSQQHWLRGGEVGQLVRFEQRGQNNWLVQFDNRYPGGGIDGNKLWLDPREFSEAVDEDPGYDTIAVSRQENNGAVPVAAG